jgi:hypothetical protein
VSTDDAPLGSRRDFAKAVALLAAAPLAAAGTASAQDNPLPKPEGPAAMAQALTEVVRLRHGKHLTDEQLQAVQRSVTGGLLSGDRLAKFPLKNGDEPAFVFSPDPQ